MSVNNKSTLSGQKRGRTESEEEENIESSWSEIEEEESIQSSFSESEEEEIEMTSPEQQDKRHLHLPVYITEREGPPHACRLKSKVILEGKTYESLEYFSTAKDAENAAAKVALMSVSSDHGTKEEDPAFFKNLLQELAQKEYSCLPAYSTTRSGPPHNSIFSSTVEINGESFVGEEAKAKKLAEMNAAKVAYIALRERKWKQSSVSSEYHVNHAFRSPMTQFTPAAGLTGAYDQGAEAKHTQMKPEFQTNFNQNICNAKVDSLPQPPSRSGLGEISGPSICSDTSPLHKKIKVFPVTPNMTLPTGATVLHRDEKWVAITMADGS
ncbi:Double-stranded RNA-binding protein 4 [Bienertia sinuspersici]